MRPRLSAVVFFPCGQKKLPLQSGLDCKACSTITVCLHIQKIGLPNKAFENANYHYITKKFAGCAEILTFAYTKKWWL